MAVAICPNIFNEGPIGQIFRDFRLIQSESHRTLLDAERKQVEIGRVSRHIGRTSREIGQISNCIGQIARSIGQTECSLYAHGGAQGGFNFVSVQKDLGFAQYNLKFVQFHVKHGRDRGSLFEYPVDLDLKKGWLPLIEGPGLQETRPFEPLHRNFF